MTQETTPITFEEFWQQWAAQGLAYTWPDKHTRMAAEAAWNAAQRAFESDAAEYAYQQTLERAKAAEAREQALRRVLSDMAMSARQALRENEGRS